MRRTGQKGGRGPRKHRSPRSPEGRSPLVVFVHFDIQFIVVRSTNMKRLNCKMDKKKRLYPKQVLQRTLIQLGANDAQSAGIIGLAVANFPLAGDIVELQPAVVAADDALGTQDGAVGPGAQQDQDLLQRGTGEDFGGLHAPGGEYLVGVVVMVVVIVAAAGALGAMVMVVMMLVLTAVMVVMLVFLVVMVAVLVMVVVLVFMLMLMLMFMLMVMVVAAAGAVLAMLMMMMFMFMMVLVVMVMTATGTIFTVLVMVMLMVMVSFLQKFLLKRRLLFHGGKNYLTVNLIPSRGN